MKCTKQCFVVLVTYSSAVAWQITLTRPGKQVEVEGDLGHSKDINAQDGDLCILIFRSLISSEKAVSIFFVLVMKLYSYQVSISLSMLLIYQKQITGQL